MVKFEKIFNLEKKTGKHIHINTGHKKLMVKVLFTFHDFLSQKVCYIGKGKTFSLSKQLGKEGGRDERVVGEKNLKQIKAYFSLVL